MKIKQYITFIVSGLALAAIVIFPAISTFWSDFNSAKKNSAEIKTVENFKAECDLRRECRIESSEGVIVLDIVPDNLPVMKPLEIALTLEGLEAERVSMQFQGRDMAMNLAPFQLFPQDSGHVYGGTGYISYCTIEKDMVWLAKLEIEAEESLITVIFELKG